MKMKLKAVLCLSAFSILVSDVSAQTYNDGPTELTIKVRKFYVSYAPGADANLNIGGGGIGFSPDELTFSIWAMDNPNTSGLTWQGVTCLQDEFDPPLATPTDFNTQLFSATYPGGISPMYFDLKLDAWQDNCGSDGVNLILVNINCGGNRCTFENQCTDAVCGGIAGVGDNNRCNATPFKTQIDYRAEGPPCKWNNHGFLAADAGVCSGDNWYQPEIESYWRYTKGTACNPTDAIDLGVMASGTVLSHYNSNECYSNTFANSPGNDVTYKFTVNAPIGIDVDVCDDSTLFDTYIYLLDNNCSIIAENDDGASAGCATNSILSYSICIPGDYYIVVDGKAAGNFGTFNLRVRENVAFSFTANIIKSDPTCFGFTNGSVTVQARPLLFPPDLPYAYQWNNSLGVDSTLTGLGDGLYSVTVTNPNNNCTISDSVTLVEPAPMIIDSIVTTNLSCSGQNDGSAKVFVSGGTTPYVNYTWSNAMQGDSIFPLSAGVYDVIVTDAEGCTITNPPGSGGTVTASDPIVIDTLSYSDITCFGDNDGSIATQVTGGNSPYTWLWTPGGFTTSSVSGLPPGPITVTVFDATGGGNICNEARTFNIHEPQPLIATVIGTIDISCNGLSDGVVVLNVSGGTVATNYSYLWSDGSTQEYLFGASAGPVSVNVTDDNGCATTADTVLTEPSAITASITVDQEAGCFGESGGALNLDVSDGEPPYGYQWSNNETTEDISGLMAGDYQVLIIDANGCTDVQSATISDLPQLTVAPQVSNPPCLGKDDGAITLSVSGAEPFSYSWSTGSVASSIDSLAPGVYQVTVTDANNCTVTQDSITVGEATFNCEGNIMDVAVPNVFSPNGDGRNDFFDLYAAPDVARISVKIYDRWGAKVHENLNQLPNMEGQGWNGKIRDKDAQLGAYTYVIEIEYSTPTTTDRPTQKTGTITVVR